MKKLKPKNLERGITLISLIMTIIIMVILAALILRTITGDHDLIGATTESTENYKIAQYREELIAEVMGVIQSSMIKGEDVTQEKIAEAIRKDLDWVKEVKVNEDETITNPDIIVISKEGYIFQVTYDDTYGSIKVDYIGKDPSGNGGEGGADEALKYIPSVTGRYDKVNTKVIGEASIAKGSIKSLEIIFKGNVLTPDEGSNLSNISKTITEGGIYEIKATTDRGITRSAYVRVNSLSGELEPPEIKETNGIHGIDSWYREGLEVTISSEDETVTEVHYLLKDASSYELEEREEITIPEVGNEESEGWVTAKGNSVTIPITTLGRTIVTAYVTDGKNKSETNTATVKYDNVVPSITVSDPGTGWHKNDVEISVSGEDNNSGINGYKYYLNDDTNGTHEKDITKPITIGAEGTTKVKVQTADKAGNVSALQERTVKLDKTGPIFTTSEIEKTNIRPTSFKVFARATDSLSGIAKYICYISENGNEILQKENTIGDFEITGLKANTRYDIRIIAVDNAGNESEVPCTGYVRTTGELKAPNLSVTPLTEGATMTGGYYKCGVRIRVSDSASADETTAVSLHYEVVDANNESLTKASGQVTNYVNFSGEGTFKVRAWAKDEEGTDGPKTAWQNFGIDTAAPTIPSISLAGTAGTNSWYKSNITVTIKAGTDVTSKVRGVQYYTEKGSVGGQAITGTIDGKYTEVAVTDGNTTSISITLDRNNKDTRKNSRQCRKCIIRSSSKRSE